MGAGSSKSNIGIQVEGDEKVFYDQSAPIKFDQGLIEHLADLPDSSPSRPTPSAGRQSALDAHVQQRLHAELQRLQREEADVKRQIAEALEHENLEKERGGRGGDAQGEDGAPLQSSETLMNDLEGIRRKVEKHRERRELAAWPEVAKAREGVMACLLANRGRSLDCWKEVADFKAAVSQVEKEFVASLR